MISGKLLNKLRSQKGLSIDDVADALNVSTSTVYRWEREDTLKDRETIEKYAEILGVSVTYLFTGEQSEPAITECAITEADPEPATPAVKKPLSLLKIGLISAASTFGLIVLITALIIICNYFRSPVSNGHVRFWVFTVEEIFVIIALAILCVTAVTAVTVIAVYLVRKIRSNTK